MQVYALLCFSVVGSLSLQLDQCQTESIDADTEGRWVGGLAAGFGVNLCACAASSLATVYSQLLLREEPSMLEANVKLYSAGALFAWAVVAVRAMDTVGEGWSPQSLTLAAWLYIINASLYGFAVAALLRKLGAVIKMFSAAGSACLVALYSTRAGWRTTAVGSTQQALLAGLTVWCSLYIFVTDGVNSSRPDELPLMRKEAVK